MADPNVLEYVIDLRSAMIGNRVYNVLREGIPIVRFHGWCDGKLILRKTKFFLVFA